MMRGARLFCGMAAGLLLACSSPGHAAPRNERIGINAARPETLERWKSIDFGWVRFENLKWAMFSPAPDTFRFDGSVKPWYVPFDKILEGYHREGLRVLPMIFLVPEHATTAGPEVKKNRLAWPPRDPAEYGEAVFQAVARYGSQQHPAEVLKTPDQLSGLGLIQAVEIWNEPNLNPVPGAEWGAWAAPLNAFWPVFRAGAEGGRRADKNIPITSPGLAGIKVESVDAFRQFHYPDGKTPLDFMDVINVHYYSGKIRPERALVDTNVERRGQKEGTRRYLDDLRDLVAWRDAYAPGRAIWLTETGYDSAGDRGISEDEQAVRLPRCVMLALAHGIDKVFIYREQGSTPSQHAASGLLRDDGSPKPVFQTLSTMVRQLNGIEGSALRLPDANEKLWAFAWPTQGGLVLSAWMEEGEGWLDWGPGRLTWVDARGQKRVAKSGKIPVSEAPVYLRLPAPGAHLQALLMTALQLEQERLAQYQQRSRQPAWLFDFGSRDFVGMRSGSGLPRRFHPVPGDLVYTPASQFGIENGPARENDAPWKGDALARDAIRLSGKTRFRVDLPPGHYEVQIGYAGVNNGTLVLSGAGPDALRIPFVSRQDVIQDLSVTVSTHPLILEAEGYLDVAWLQILPAESTP